MDSSQAVYQDFLQNGLVFLMLLCTVGIIQCLVHIGHYIQQYWGKIVFLINLKFFCRVA